jgi:HSP90 family molecular chaperone
VLQIEGRALLFLNALAQVDPLVKADSGKSKVEDAAWLLFDQALLLEGVPLKDPALFVQRLNRVLNQAI